MKHKIAKYDFRKFLLISLFIPIFIFGCSISSLTKSDNQSDKIGTSSLMFSATIPVNQINTISFTKTMSQTPTKKPTSTITITPVPSKTMFPSPTFTLTEKTFQESLNLNLEYIEIENIDDVDIIQEMEHSVVYTLAFSPKSSLLATGGEDRKICIWNVNDGSKVVELQGHTAAIKDIAFSPSGVYLASVSNNNEIIIWEVDKWGIVQEILQDDKGIYVDYLTDNKLITGTNKGILSIWDTESNELISEVRVPRNQNAKCNDAMVYSYDIHPDKETFAAYLSCGYSVSWKPITNGGYENHVAFYNNQNLTNTIPYVGSVAFSPDGEYLAFSNFYNRGNYFIGIGYLPSGKFSEGIGTANINVPCITYSTYGELLLAGIGSTIRVWPNYYKSYVGIGKSIRDLQEHKNQILAIEFNQDNTLFATGDYQGQIFIWGISH